MKRLAWFEVLNAHSDVLHRYPIDAFPLAVGRDYHNDVVLDDPCIAPAHLEIRVDDAGQYQLHSLNSINGVRLNQQCKPVQDTALSADDVVQIGQTTFRIRPVDYVVPPEQPLLSPAWIWRWQGMLLGSLVLFSERVLGEWLNYSREDMYNSIWINITEQIPLLLIWVWIWAMLGKLQVKRADWQKHFVIATLGGALWLLLLDMSGYVSFALNANSAELILTSFIEPLVFAGVWYLHLRLVSRLTPRRLAGIVLLMVGSASGVFYVKDQFSAENNLTYMPYTRTIGSPDILLTHGQTPDEFIAAARRLKPQVDE